MNEDCLKLTTYFGERDRVDGNFLADALLDLYGRHGLKTSVLLRGAEGFGLKHRVHTQRLLSLSEDLPLVAAAVDTRERVEGLVPQVAELMRDGLLTLERAALLTGHAGEGGFPARQADQSKLTVYCGRQERIRGRPAFLEVVRRLREIGLAGATVLFGVDGTAHGVRERATFFGRNPDVPLMIISVGDPERIARVTPELIEALSRPLMTLERVTVCKRDGQRIADLPHLRETDERGLNMWQKLTVYAGEQNRHGSQPLYLELIRRLREAGAAGATVLRGVWGYHGDHQPHGDRVFGLRRRVPVMTVIVDRPERIRRWFEIVDQVTSEAGLVTSEIVPAMRATSAEVESGGLRIAEVWASSASRRRRG